MTAAAAAVAVLDGDGRHGAPVAARLAACARLAGCTGRRAIEALVTTLDDPAATVRRAAVAALAQTAARPGHSWRLAHAAFHRRADVRSCAAASPSLRPELLLSLRSDADAAVRDSARAALQARVSTTPGLVGHLLTARRRGALDDVTLRELLAGAPWRDSATAILRGLPQGPTAPAAKAPPDDVDTFGASLHAAGADMVVDLIQLLARDDALRARALDGLTRAWRRRHLDADDRRRLARGIAVVAAMGEAVPPELLALGMAGSAAVVGLDAIPVGDRRRALATVPALRLPGHADDAAALFRTAAPLLPTTAVWFSDDIEVLAGLAALAASGGWTAVLATIPVGTLAEQMARLPSPTLLSIVPGGGAERAAWTALLRLVAVVVRQLPWDEPIDVAAWLAALLRMPADALTLLDDLEAVRPGVASRMLTLVVDGGEGATGDAVPADELLVEHDTRRRERALDALAVRCGPTTRAGLLRLALDGAIAGEDVVAALCRCAPLDELAETLDALDPRRRPAALDVALRVARPVWTPATLAAALRRPASPTVVALARRDAPPAPIDVDAVADLPWAHFAATVLAQAATMRLSGVVELVLARVGRGDRPPATDATAVISVLLCAWDPPHRVARAIALAGSGADDLAPAVAALRGIPLALLPHLAAALVAPHAADARLAPLLDDAPGGVRGQIELALSTDAPWAVWWLSVLDEHLQRRRAADPTGTRRLFADVGLQRLADDIAGGTLLTPDDPRRPVLLRMLAATSQTSSSAPATSSAPPPRPWPEPLATLQTLAEPSPETAASLVAHLDDDEVAAVLHDALIVGGIDSGALQGIARQLPAASREGVVREALRVTTSAEAQAGWLRLLPLATTSLALQPLQSVLRWGARQALQLCGAPFTISLSTEGLGHTRIGRRRIFVNPLPMLQQARDGEAIVRGLILHELGHHRHHGGAAGQAVWRQAQDERLHPLLNLVADEHLERNLRALSPHRYGAPLKTLAAWAFQHMHRELPWPQVLAALGARAHAVLCASDLAVARRPEDALVDVGSALSVLSRQGSSMSRFMRALRMGKADPSGDPKVKEALALFPAHTFRASTMPELLAIARRLREIFGDEAGLLDAFDFHRLTDAADDDLAAAGVDPDTVKPEPAAPRPRLRGPPRGGRGRPGGRGLNVDEDVSFDEIHHVERVAADVARHRQVAALVRRPSQALRRHLLRLGEGPVVERRRLSGRRLDRGALVGSVLRGDPRLLTSRRTLPSPDVFVGVVIDCSGSMDGENLERATSFAVLLAEAVRGLPDIDARFFGFTDSTIFDAGDARRCAVTALQADGGNNDAAALAHVARVARASGRQAILLVMISDGAPTECSVPALRAVVDRLELRGMLCAQVAVEAIDDDDICFRRHVLLEDDDLAGAARRFGRLLESLLTVARAPGHTQRFIGLRPMNA